MAMHREHQPMTIAAQIGKVSSNLETATRAGEFATVVKLYSAARGDLRMAAQMARARSAGKIADLLEKAAVSAGGLANPNWEVLGDYGNTISGFLNALRSTSCFDAMLPSMQRLPPRTRVVSAGTGAVGYVVSEGSARPVTSMSL